MNDKDSARVCAAQRFAFHVRLGSLLWIWCLPSFYDLRRCEKWSTPAGWSFTAGRHLTWRLYVEFRGRKKTHTHTRRTLELKEEWKWWGGKEEEEESLLFWYVRKSIEIFETGLRGRGVADDCGCAELHIQQDCADWMEYTHTNAETQGGKCASRHVDVRSRAAL